MQRGTAKRGFFLFHDSPWASGWSYHVGIGFPDALAVGVLVRLTIPSTGLPETYGPVLTKRERRINPEASWKNVTKSSFMSVPPTFTSLFTMTIKEPILLFASLYHALVYEVLHLGFHQRRLVVNYDLHL